jgi:hypothetical protein
MLGEQVGQPPGGGRHDPELPPLRQLGPVGDDELHVLGKLGSGNGASPKRGTPSSSSRLLTSSLTADWARWSLRAAAEKLPSSAAAMKVRS